MKYRNCIACGEKKPLTEEYFDRCRKGDAYLRHMCKECAEKYGGYFDCPEWKETPRMKMVKKCRTFMRTISRRTFVGSSQLAVGLSATELADYLLETYKRNYGIEWDGECAVDIDHVIPLSSRRGKETIVDLWNYRNLQLLKTEDNRKKGSQYNGG